MILNNAPLQPPKLRQICFIFMRRLLELGGWAKRVGLIEDYLQCWAGLNFFQDPPGPVSQAFLIPHPVFLLSSSLLLFYNRPGVSFKKNLQISHNFQSDGFHTLQTFQSLFKGSF
jgi:hypothetical protein